MIFVAYGNLRERVIEDIGVFAHLLKLRSVPTDVDHLLWVALQRSLITCEQTVCRRVVGETFYLPVLNAKTHVVADLLTAYSFAVEGVKFLYRGGLLVAYVNMVARGIVGYGFLVVVVLAKFSETMVLYVGDIPGGVDIDAEVIISFCRAGIGDNGISVTGKAHEAAVVAGRHFLCVILWTDINEVGDVVRTHWRTYEKDVRLRSFLRLIVVGCAHIRINHHKKYHQSHS